MEPLRISAKNLGQLALRQPCERCFWVQLKCGFKMPYQKFPGIFSSIDKYSKRVTVAHHRHRSALPLWFEDLGELGELVPVPHHSRFNFLDEKTGILLTGVPDEIIRRGDRSLLILDYKTASYSAGQDELMPMYVAQLNAYGVIARRIGMGETSGLGLIYYEPMTGGDDESVESLIRDDGFALGFSARLVKVEVVPQMVPALLGWTRELARLPEAPASPGVRIAGI